MNILRHLTSLLIVGIGIGFSGVGPEASEPSIYSKMLTPSPLGNARVLALCLPEKRNDENLMQFYDNVSWKEYSERHLVIVEVSRHTVQSVFPDSYGIVNEISNRARHEDFGDKIRGKADCKKDLKFVLIGKDTGVKQRWEAVPAQGELFQIIDAMPMRRFEMRQQREKN